jgi:hypothetical protein
MGLTEILSRAPVEPFDALLVLSNPMLFTQRVRILEFAAEIICPGSISGGSSSKLAGS